MRLHALKCRSDQYWQIAAKQKTAELRKNDRDYQYGDLIELHECDSQGNYGNSSMMFQVTGITTHESWPELLQPGVVMLGLQQIEGRERELCNKLAEYYYRATSAELACLSWEERLRSGELVNRDRLSPARDFDTSFPNNIVGHGAG